MSEIVEDFEKKARLQDDDEAEIIRQKLESLVNNILVQVATRDNRFQSTLVQCGSVPEGVKVNQPDEFDFMVRIDSLTKKPALLYPCKNIRGYVKLAQDEERWEEFKDEQGFFSPNKLCRHFKRLVNESWSAIEVPEGLSIQKIDQNLIEGPWGSVYSGLVGGDSDPSDVMYIESHGPATTIKILWQGGSSYNDLEVSVDLTLALEYNISKLPVQLPDLPQCVDVSLKKNGFHVVPAGFDMWRVSFSMVEKDVLSGSPDGFKACYRVLKYARDTVAKGLDLEPSLVPSYIFKSALLCQLFTAERDSWEKEHWTKRVDHTLEVILQGVMQGDISSFFLSGHNLLATTDHKNKLRQFIVENMLNLVKGLMMTHTREEVKETKRQIRVLETIDVLEFLLFSALTGKDMTTLWNKLFVNIDDIPTDESEKSKFLTQLTDLDSLEIDKDVYVELVQKWAALEFCFKQLITFLPEEHKILAHKFFIRTCNKRKQFELKHPGATGYPIEQISIHQVVGELIIEYTDDYIDEKDASAKYFSNLYKAIPPDYRPLGIFKDVADVTMKEGSDQGHAAFNRHLKEWMSQIPESVLISVIVGYISQIFNHGQEMIRRKLYYITIPELDLD